LEATVLDRLEKLLAPCSLVLVTKKNLPQAFVNPKRVLYAKQWFVFLKSHQVYFADWLCFFIASIALSCSLLSIYQHLPIKDMTTPELPIQPYNPKNLP
jgi:hypothetical protein